MPVPVPRLTDDAVLDRVGHSTYPAGDDAERPFWDVASWVTAEVVHHGAEVGLLRDLYASRHGGGRH